MSKKEDSTFEVNPGQHMIRSILGVISKRCTYDT